MGGQRAQLERPLDVLVGTPQRVMQHAGARAGGRAWVYGMCGRVSHRVRGEAGHAGQPAMVTGDRGGPAPRSGAGAVAPSGPSDTRACCSPSINQSLTVTLKPAVPPRSLNRSTTEKADLYCGDVEAVVLGSHPPINSCRAPAPQRRPTCTMATWRWWCWTRRTPCLTAASGQRFASPCARLLPAAPPAAWAAACSLACQRMPLDALPRVEATRAAVPPLSSARRASPPDCPRRR